MSDLVQPIANQGEKNQRTHYFTHTICMVSILVYELARLGFKLLMPRLAFVLVLIFNDERLLLGKKLVSEGGTWVL